MELAKSSLDSGSKIENITALEDELFLLMEKGAIENNFKPLLERCQLPNTQDEEFYPTFFKALGWFDDETQSRLVKNPQFDEAMRAFNVPELMIVLMKEQLTEREMKERQAAA